MVLYDDYLKTLTCCPFCDRSNFGPQIISENKNAALIVSLAPYQKHHLLIIPKRHLEKILDITPEEITDINKLQEIAIKTLYGLDYADMTVLVREGENIGKSVRHLHYHVVPEVLIGTIEVSLMERKIYEREEISKLLQEFQAIIKEATK